MTEDTLLFDKISLEELPKGDVPEHQMFPHKRDHTGIE